ncbi:MAG: NTP pyrophosphohydrolase [Chloroflexi bacterium RBG_16_48_8]|nr:MAG: NTP pyrophosphohydrolase [Chloroflexi bacterium RBG_16_48_8]
MDHETCNNELHVAVQRFITERNWDRYHTPKNLAMSIAIEAAELMEHFQWVTNEQSIEIIQDDVARVQVADELADILIYCLSFLNKIDVDINTAILRKLRRDEDRYPIGRMPTED